MITDYAPTDILDEETAEIVSAIEIDVETVVVRKPPPDPFRQLALTNEDLLAYLSEWEDHRSLFPTLPFVPFNIPTTTIQAKKGKTMHAIEALIDSASPEEKIVCLDIIRNRAMEIRASQE